MRKTVASLAAATTIITGGIVAAAPAQASTTYTASGCPTRTTSTMLSGFGDYNQYFDAYNAYMGGSNNAWYGYYTLYSENEPWRVNPASQTNSIGLWTQDYAMSPKMCLSAGQETFRFFYKGTGQSGSQLTVKATIESDTGTYIYNYRIDASRTGWALSPTLGIPMYSTSGTQNVTLQFSNTSSFDTSRPIQIDDALVDPWRSRGY